MKYPRRLLVWSGVLLAIFLLLAGRLVAAQWSRGPGDSWPWLIWGIAQLAGLAWAVRRLDSICAQPIGAEAKALGLVLVLPFLWNDLGREFPCITVFSVLVALAGFSTARGGRPFLGGCVLGLAPLLLPGFVLLLPWLVYRLRMRMLSGFISSIVVFTAVAWTAHGHPGFGFSGFGFSGEHVGALDLLGLGETPGGSDNQSLLGLLERFLPADSPVVRWLIYGIVLLAAEVGLLVAAWRRYPGLRLRPSAGEVGAALAGSILLAPCSAIADHVALYPAAVLGFEAWRRSSTAARRTSGAILWFAALVCAAVVLIGELTGQPLIAGAFLPFVCGGLLLVLLSHPRFFPTRRLV